MILSQNIEANLQRFYQWILNLTVMAKNLNILHALMYWYKNIEHNHDDGFICEYHT